MLTAPTPTAPAWHAAARTAQRRAGHRVRGSCEAATRPPCSVLAAGNEKRASGADTVTVGLPPAAGPPPYTPSARRVPVRSAPAPCLLACLVVVFSPPVAVVDARGIRRRHTGIRR